MEVSRVSNQITIQSHKGEYIASFICGGMDQLNNNLVENAVYIIDKNISQLYANRLNSSKIAIITGKAIAKCTRGGCINAGISKGTFCSKSPKKLVNNGKSGSVIVGIATFHSFYKNFQNYRLYHTIIKDL